MITLFDNIEEKVKHHTKGRNQCASEEISENQWDGKINELLKVRDPEGSITSFKYDALGREISKITPNNVITETTYDPVGRIITIKNINRKNGRHGDSQDVLKSLAYLYNDAGERVFQIEDDGKITSYNYDQIGRVDTVKYPFNSSKRVEDFRERLSLGLFPEYEAKKGNGKGRGNDDDDEIEFNIPGFDRDDDYNEFRDKIKESIKEKHDVYRHYKKMDKYNHGRWHIKIEDGATEFASKLNVDAVTASLLKEAYSDISSNNHNHNHLDTDQWVWTEKYQYDETNNRSRKSNGWGVIDYSYNPANEILKAGKREYEHDLNGNMIKEKLGVVEGIFEYNPENRTTNIYSEFKGFMGHNEWSLEAGVKYEYDAFGRRISRVEYKEYNGNHKNHNYVWKNETNESYIYDGLSFNVLAEMRDKEFDHPKVPDWGWWKHHHYKGKYQPISEYIYGNGRIINRTDFNEYESKSKGFGHYNWKNKEYYSQDILGSTILLTNEIGQTKERYSYDAFGNRYEGNFNRINDYGYNGKRYDLAVGLYDYGFRDYKPQLGRWTTFDLIHYGKNWYDYCNNDPINFIDPTGLITFFTNGTCFKAMEKQWDAETYYNKYDPTFAINVAMALEGEKATVDKTNYLNWSGANTKSARTQMIDKFVEQIIDYNKANPNEPINLVGHSHGRNVNVMIANELAKKDIPIANFVALNGINRTDSEYQLKGNNVKNYIEIYDKRDPVRNLFAEYDNWMIPFGILGLLFTFGLSTLAQLPKVTDFNPIIPYDVSKIYKGLNFHNQSTRTWEYIKGAFDNIKDNNEDNIKNK